MHNLSPHFPPKNSRTHEVCGPSAATFAFALGGALEGKVLWVREAWLGEAINPVSFATFLDPKQLLMAQAPSHLDALAVAEEALRSGDIALVVMELTQPIGLTEGRRLLDLSRFSAAPSARLSYLSFESDGAFPAQC